MFEKYKDSLDSFLKQKEDIIVTSTTIDFIDMCLNWYISLSKVGLAEQVIVIALDKESYFKLQEKNIFTVLFETNMNNKTAEDWIENAKKYKPLGVIHLYENYDVNIIHLDTDMYYFKNFLPKLKEECEGYDIVMCSDKRFEYYNTSRERDKIITVNYDKKTVTDWGPAEQAKYGDKNGAVFYLPKNKKDRIIPFLKLHLNKSIIEKFPKGIQDGSLQTITNDLLRKGQTDIKIKTLNIFDFPNGSLWKIPYLRNKVKDSCYLVHYNYHSHADPKARLKEKVEAMKQYGHWFL